MSLYLDYRPKNLDEFYGNTGTVKALKSVLNRKEKIPHAILFTGESGCGKTTLARIVAKELGCMEHDFYEMDSAHYSGVDSIRDIRQNMKFGSLSGGHCRVWLLDECHQLSTAAQNTLLKVLEDTPKHVYLILATTDPQKLLKTIINRCMIFKVSSLSDEYLSRLLNYVIENEDKEVPDSAIDHIIDNSLGSPRMALVLLDKIIDLDKRNMARTVTQAAQEESQTIELCQALLAEKPWTVVSKILKQLNQEPETIRRNVLGYCNSVLLNKDNPVAAAIIYYFENSFFNSGKAGLTLACYEFIKKVK
jgi:DNA polymerase-3 subunit gamma/tau